MAHGLLRSNHKRNYVTKQSYLNVESKQKLTIGSRLTCYIAGKRRNSTHDSCDIVRSILSVSVKFNVKFSTAGDGINFTLWLDVDSSDAYQPSVLALFDKDGPHLPKPSTFENAKKTTGCRERSYIK